jgi:hypothetical protein
MWRFSEKATVVMTELSGREPHSSFNRTGEYVTDHDIVDARLTMGGSLATILDAWPGISRQAHE